MSSCPYTGNNQTQKAICDCLKSSQELSNSIKLYEDTLASNATATYNYNNADGTYKANKSAWQEKRRVRKTELENEEKTWNNCVLWTGVYGHDDWCEGDTGFGRQTGAGGYGCAWGQGKGKCQRTTDQVNSAITAWATGENTEPQAPTQPTLVNPSPPTATIQCCGISIDNLTSTSLNLSDISQKCTSSGGSGSSAGVGTGSSAGVGTGSGAGIGVVGVNLPNNSRNYMISSVFLIISFMLSCVLLLISSVSGVSD